MKRHTVSGRVGLGLALALFTALVWGTMPVALKFLVGWLDPYTLSCARFLAAGLLIAPLVLRRHGARALRAAAEQPLLTAVCVVGLTGNYVLYQAGLRFLSPDAAQMIIQLSPMLALIGGLVVFREPFSRLQSLGSATLVVGMLLYFNRRFVGFSAPSGAYALGVLLVAIAAVFWAAYMLAQKQLLLRLAPETILLVTYIAGACLLLPAARPQRLATLQPGQLALLGAVVLGTLSSYLSFGEAMNHLEASRMGAVVAVSPLLTVASTAALAAVAPGIVVAEHLNALSVVGAVLVVGGSAATALAGRR